MQEQVLLKALQPLRCDNVPRKRRERFTTDEQTAHYLIQGGYAVKIDAVVAWHEAPRRELRLSPPVPRAWGRVVACLNIWNDRKALEQTLPTWIDRVDHVIAVDGAYLATGAKGPSEDGTLDYLRALGDKVTLLTRETCWPDQVSKRNAYLALAREGDLLFIVDADEFVLAPEELLRVPDLDVGWVTVSSPLYNRLYGQPRLLRWQPGLRYDQRHHWLYVGERLLATHQYAGLAFHRTVPLVLRNERGLGHSEARKAAKMRALILHSTQEKMAAAAPQTATSDANVGGRESLQIVQVTGYDAGGVAYRLHTGINATTPHCSLFARRDPDNVFRYPRQFDAEADEEMVRAAIKTADVVHTHLRWLELDHYAQGTRAALVIHHHGTMFRKMADYFRIADSRACLRLISNLELTRYGDNLHWLPNPMPVAEYRRLAASMPPRHPGPLVIGHSPSKRALKGTETFLAVCERLRAKGVPLRVELIEGVTYAESIKRKVGCDLFFDSFDLGIQCSGLEAAALGIPVIAGDPYVARQYRARFGDCPYTFAEDGDELEAVVERMVRDADYRQQEAQQVTGYVERVHDEAAVALRYLDLLDHAMGWRRAMRLKREETKAEPVGAVTVPTSRVRHPESAVAMPALTR